MRLLPSRIPAVSASHHLQLIADRLQTTLLGRCAFDESSLPRRAKRNGGGENCLDELRKTVVTIRNFKLAIKHLKFL